MNTNPEGEKSPIPPDIAKKLNLPLGQSSFGRTICEVHREMYQSINKLHEHGKLSENHSEFLKSRIEEAFTMAKKMNNKLRQYKYNYDDDWWEKNKLHSDIDLDK